MTQRARILLYIMLAVMLTAPIVAVAQPVDSLEENSFPVWYDFESGTYPSELNNCNGDASIVQQSFEDTYSISFERDSDTVCNPEETLSPAISGSSNVMYSRVYIPSEGAPIDGERVATLGYERSGSDGRKEIQYDSDTGNIGVVDAEVDTFDPIAEQNFNLNTWYNFMIDVNTQTNEVDYYVWESGTGIPTTPMHHQEPSYNINSIDTVIWAEMGFSIGHPDWFYTDEMGWGESANASINGTVSDLDGNPLQDSTVNVTQSGSLIRSVETDINGTYFTLVDNGTYNMTAKKPGYINATRTNVTVNGTAQVDFTLINTSENFEFDIDNWMEHGSTQTWDASFITEQGEIDVSDSVTVTSNNTSIVTVQNASNQLTATSDRSVSDQTYVTVTYENFTTHENVTVANRTLDNIGVMPPSEWHTTVLGFGESQAQWGVGSEIQWILVAIFTGAGAAWIAKNEWIGIGIIDAALLLFWVLGRVGLGIMLVAVFYSLMAGYQLQQTPSRSDTDVGSRIPDQFTREP